MSMQLFLSRIRPAVCLKLFIIIIIINLMHKEILCVFITISTDAYKCLCFLNACAAFGFLFVLFFGRKLCLTLYEDEDC